MKTFDADGNELTATDPIGDVTSNTWDGDGNLIAVKNAAGATQRKAYDLADQLVSSTDYRGKTTKYTWANASQQATATDPDNDVTKQSFDSYGNVASAVDADGNTTTFTYDLDGNKPPHHTPPPARSRQQPTTPPGTTHLHRRQSAHTTKYSYDADGEPIAVTDPLGQVTTTSYTPDGKVLRVAGRTRARRSTPTTATTTCSRIRIPVARSPATPITPKTRRRVRSHPAD